MSSWTSSLSKAKEKWKNLEKNHEVFTQEEGTQIKENDFQANTQELGPEHAEEVEKEHPGVVASESISNPLSFLGISTVSVRAGMTRAISLLPPPPPFSLLMLFLNHNVMRLVLSGIS